MKLRLARPLFAGTLLALSLTLSAAHQQGGDEPTGPGSVAQLQREVDRIPGAPASLYEQALARLEDRLRDHPGDLEASLFKALIHFKSGLFDESLQELDALTRRAPRFHLAHLIKGDLLLAQTRTVSDIGALPLLGGLAGQDISHLRDEAEMRLKAYLDALPQERLPSAFLALGESVGTALLVDKYTHRLYVYERAEPDEPPRLVRDFYVSTGKLVGNKALRGDLRTPEGVYFITSHIPESRLPDRYGSGAFPTNYPNEWDRRLGKTGYGIWLHGTETGFYSRPPLDSEGCVVLPNLDLNKVAKYIRPGVTPIVITERAEWLEPSEWEERRAAVLGALEAWRTDWESGDVERYLSHYADDFWSPGFDLRRWNERKRQVAVGKRFQQVRLDDISIFPYPRSGSGDKEMVVVNLEQDYVSNNFTSRMGKRLYLAREGGRWQVLYEGRR